MRPARLPVCALLAGLLNSLFPAGVLAQSGAAPPVAEAATGALAQAGEKPRFDVLEFRIEGNTVLPSLKIEEAVYPYLGEGKTIDDVDAARGALEKAYQNAGYLTVLVDLPEQQVKGGVVTLRVVEGKVEKLRVTGNRYYSRGVIRAQVPELAEGNVPYFPEVQKELAGLSKSPDRQVTPVLRAGKTPGTVEAELKVEDQLPLHGGVELNNRQTPNTRPLRLDASLRYDNLWQMGHSLSVSFQTAPQETSNTRVWAGSYVLPIPNSDVALAFYAIDSNSDVAAVGDVNVIGSGNIYGFRAIVPLPPGSGFYQSFSAGLDYKDLKENTALRGGDSFNSPISYAPLTLQYNATLQGESSTSRLTLTSVLGLRSFLGNRDSEFQQKRFNANANFATLRADFSHNQRLAGGWEVVGRINGQVANQALVSSEQFAIGGLDSVRGYKEAEELGDQGVQGSLEVRTRAFALGDLEPPFGVYALAFVDGGYVMIYDPLPGQRESWTLTSAGVGLRMPAWRGVNAGFLLAVPFNTTPYTEKNTVQALFRIGYDF